jgi:asparagine synthetase B (glutamine-hydrolysing)
MCGICGVMYERGGADLDREPAPSEAAAIMLRDMVHRGRDATGWAYPASRGEKIWIRKLAAPANRVTVDMPLGVPWWMGHVRLATHGTPRYEGNNHPIHHGGVVGVHNGVISNAERILDMTGRQDPRAAVDSEALFAAIDALGIRRGLELVSGSFATAWADLRWPRTHLYIARDFGRPLWIGRAETGATYFASEVQTLEALAREGLSFESMAVFKGGTYAALVPGRIKWIREFRADLAPRAHRRPYKAKPKATPARKPRARAADDDRPWFLLDDYEFPDPTRPKLELIRNDAVRGTKLG